MDLGFEGGFSVHKSSIPSFLENLPIARNLPSFRHLPELNFETVFACDVNRKARLSWENFMSAKRSVNNIYKEESVIDIVKRISAKSLGILDGIEVVTGGFPCNDFSVAGKRLGFDSNKSHRGNHSLVDEDLEDPTAENRGMLYFWMREFVSKVRPKIFYAENVKGLISLGDAKEIIERDFSAINGSSYLVIPARVLRAHDFGGTSNTRAGNFYWA